MKKIAFITCVNDEEMYSECLRYIKNLNVPPGFEVETIGIRGAKSLTSGYNLGMRSTDAKYKVYLHQDGFIINKNFIYDIIKIFEMDNKIGLIGVIGAKVVPTSGVWFKSQVNVYGKVYENSNYESKMKLLSHKEVLKDYEEVNVVDGLIIITQYDISWREDLFDGWHFYDASQCIEFLKKGYKVVVPRQDEPWCIHDCGFVEIDEEYEKYRNVFLDEYSDFLFPRVSILIPAYRPHFFKIAFESAVKQTYRNIEIVVCDNSSTSEIEEYVKHYKEFFDKRNIIYSKNRTEMEVVDLFNKLISLSSGEYISFLMDDDVYHKRKIEIMMNYFLEYENITLVTSHRQPIDEKGNFLPNIMTTTRLFDKEIIIEGEKVIKELIVPSLCNFIGDMSVPLFRRNDIELPFGSLDGNQFFANTDLAAWIKLLDKGKMVYNPQTLVYFRIHKGQDQRRRITRLRGLNEIYELIIFFIKCGYYANEEYKLNKIKKWLDAAIETVLELKSNELTAKEMSEYEKLIAKIENALALIYKI